MRIRGRDAAGMRRDVAGMWRGCRSMGGFRLGQRETSKHCGQRRMAAWEPWVFRGCARRQNSGSW